MSYDQSCTPTLLNMSAISFLAAILKMAEFEVAMNHFGTCIIWRTYGVNFMLVSSTKVFPQICSLSSSANMDFPTNNYGRHMKTGPRFIVPL